MAYRLSAKDLDILRFLAAYVNLQSHHLTSLTGRRSIPSRPDQIMQARLRALRSLGFADSVFLPDEKWAAAMWFLTQKGWDFAFDRGWITKRIRAPEHRSNKNARHDLGITELHLAIHILFPKEFEWRQHYHELYHRWGNGDYDGVNPDAFFLISPDGNIWYPFFLEYENSREAKYRDKESNLVRKLKSYVNYKESGEFERHTDFDNFRVLTILPSGKRVENILRKLETEGGGLDTKRFVFASQDDLEHLGGEIFRHPRSDGVYSLADLIR